MRLRPANELVAALVCAVALVLIGIAAFHSQGLRAHDAAALAGFVVLSWHSQVQFVANVSANSVDPIPYAVLLIGLVAVALRRRRRGLAVIVPAAMLCASGSTEVVKHLFAQYRAFDWLGHGYQVGAASFPSGHTTAAVMVALAAVLIAPARTRRFVAPLACAYAIAVSLSVLILAWHYPSDVVGAYLMAGFWISLTLIAIRAADRRWPGSVDALAPLDRRSLYAPLPLLALLGACALVALALPSHVAETFGSADRWRLVIALLIATVAALVTASVVIAARPAHEPEPDPNGESPLPTLAMQVEPETAAA